MRIVWTEMMDQYIIDNYGRIPKSDIARKLGVSIRTIAYRARFLGIPPISSHEAMQNASFRKAVGEKISKGQRGVIRSSDRYLSKHPEVNVPYRFKKGHRVSDSGQEKAKWGKRKTVYDELVRMKYGLPKRTSLKLKTRQYIDRKKYFPEDTTEKQ